MGLRRVIASIALAATAGVGFTAVPAAVAAPVCEPPTPGRRIAAVPWAQQRFGMDRVSSLASGAGVTVAVIDSGVDATHEQLRDKLGYGTDFLRNSGSGWRDCVGHGTQVASIIAGRKVDKVGFRGLAPGVRILPIRVTESQEQQDGSSAGEKVSPADFAASIDWAVRQGARIINMSVVLYDDYLAVRRAIERAVKADVLVVAAAGNRRDKGNPKPYPAAYAGVLGVGAIVADGTRLPQSQVGSWVDVVAPGGDITAAWIGGGQVGGLSGTSYAAPFVSATAALLWEYYPDLSARDIVRRIMATADPAPGGSGSTEYGAGVVNPHRALTELVASGGPERAAPLPAASVDLAAQAAGQGQAETRQLALWLGLAGGLVAAVTLLCAVVVPRGRRRQWRPAD